MLEGVRQAIEEQGATPVGADDGGPRFDDAGTPIARGALSMRFMSFDAGTEEFLLTGLDGGVRVQARVLPKGGPQKPFFLDMRFDGDHRFTRARYTELTDPPLVAEYRRDGGRVVATARRGGGEPDEQVVELPDDWEMGSPIFAADYVTTRRHDLAVGESTRYTGLTFGNPTWKVVSAPVELTRLEEDDHDRPRYEMKMDTGMGELTALFATDERGVVETYELRMPFGKVSATLDREP